MILEFDFISIIIILGVSQGLLFAASVLFFKTKNEKQAKANKLLTGFLFAVSACLSSSLFYRTSLFKYYPHITLTTDPFRVLLGPLLYFYVKNLTILNFEYKKKHLIHVLPFILYLIILLPLYLKSGDYKIDYVLKNILDTVTGEFSFHKFLWSLTSFHFACYLFIIHRLIRHHNNRLKDILSSIDKKINLKWIHIILTLFLVTFAGFFLFNTIVKLVDKNWVLDIRIFHILMTTLLYGFAYRGLSQQFTFNFEPVKDQEATVAAVKYKASKITTQDSADYYKKLISFMETRQPYFDPDLSLSKLAESISIPKRYLSQAINEHSQYNFYCFINQYRIKFASKMLRDQSNTKFSILDIAYESGFNSKSTFNKAFKQITGLTPSQYRKKNITD